MMMKSILLYLSSLCSLISISGQTNLKFSGSLPSVSVEVNRSVQFTGLKVVDAAGNPVMGKKISCIFYPAAVRASLTLPPNDMLITMPDGQVGGFETSSQTRSFSVKLTIDGTTVSTLIPVTVLTNNPNNGISNPILERASSVSQTVFVNAFTLEPIKVRCFSNGIPYYGNYSNTGVTFTIGGLPGNASGTFPNGQKSMTVSTDPNGYATSFAIRANDKVGTFYVTVTFGNTGRSQVFSITNAPANE